MRGILKGLETPVAYKLGKTSQDIVWICWMPFAASFLYVKTDRPGMLQFVAFESDVVARQYAERAINVPEENSKSLFCYWPMSIEALLVSMRTEGDSELLFVKNNFEEIQVDLEDEE